MDLARRFLGFALPLLGGLFVVGGLAAGMSALMRPASGGPPQPWLQVVAQTAATSVLPSAATGGNDRVTLLIMGVDRRPGEAEWDARSDSLMVVSLDPRTKQASVLSIPRDLWVPIPLRGSRSPVQDRINAAYEDLVEAQTSVANDE